MLFGGDAATLPQRVRASLGPHHPSPLPERSSLEAGGNPSRLPIFSLRLRPSLCNPPRTPQTDPRPRAASLRCRNQRSLWPPGRSLPLGPLLPDHWSRLHHRGRRAAAAHSPEPSGHRHRRGSVLQRRHRVWVSLNCRSSRLGKFRGRGARGAAQSGSSFKPTGLPTPGALAVPALRT